MRNLIFLFCALFAEEIEVRLKTAAEAKPVYLVMDHPLRTVLEFDLNGGGFLHVVDRKAPHLIQVFEDGNMLQATVVNPERGTKRHFANIPADRKGIHRLSDLIYKELFGIEGIASCRLLYAQRDSSGIGFISEIYCCDSDGANPERITFDNDYCVTPSFYPKSEDFFYISYKQGQSKIFRSNVKSKKSELAFELRGSQVLPSMDRQGVQMAFISDVAGRPDLFVHSFGKSRQLFSAPRATQASPTFSPDGQKIAFVSDKDGSPRVYLMDLHQVRKSLHLLTKRNRENTSPAWSPDGKKLAYSAKVDGVRQIWLYDFETEDEIPLTSGGVNKENPSWAPDSLHLVYNTENEDESELFILQIKQKVPIQITSGGGQKRFPAWEIR
jgi:TolB protein